MIIQRAQGRNSFDWPRGVNHVMFIRSPMSHRHVRDFGDRHVRITAGFKVRCLVLC
jgi:hypothetical protein